MTTEADTLAAENARLKAELAAATAPKPLYCKVSQKGAVSVYGLGRFPVTLYAEQWERLSLFIGEVSDFIVAHESELSRKQ